VKDSVYADMEDSERQVADYDACMMSAVLVIIPS